MIGAMVLAPDVVVRRGVPDDAEALTDLHLDAWDDAYTGLIPQPVLDERRRDVPARIERHRSMLEGTSVTWVAVAHGSRVPGGLIGLANSVPTREADLADLVDRPGWLDLRMLYVRGSWWGRGVGHALLEASVADAACSLWVLEGNDRAVRFYQRQGFSFDGVAEDHEHGRHLRMLRRAIDRRP